MPFAFPVFQDKKVKQGETLAEELKASQEKYICQASKLHAKELEVMQSQVENLKQDLSSSKVKTHELEKMISKLQAYKEQVQVSISCQRYRHVNLIMFTFFDVGRLFRHYLLY